MKWRRWLVGQVMGLMADPARQRKRELRAAHKARQQGAGWPQLHFFYQADDPYSHLMAQVLPTLLAQFQLEYVFHLVPPGYDDVVPERAMQERYARRDCAMIAPWYGVHFLDSGHAPRAELLSIAQCILSTGRVAQQPELPARVGHALWQGDALGLQTLAAEFGFSEVGASLQNLLRGDRMRTACGHYLGGTLYFEGTCYHGIDRMHYLQARLMTCGLLRAERDAVQMILPVKNTAQLALPPPLAGAAQHDRLVLEFFASLRSPYTWLAIDRVIELSQRYHAKIVLRPVLPMVMRGLPVPRKKGAYIMMDAAREAQILGIPFGHIFDPVGEPVQRAYSLFDWVRGQAQELVFFQRLLRAAFAEGRDIYAKATLRQIIEDLGLSWREALQEMDNEDWQQEIEQNRLDMQAHQCWGVPSFVLRDPTQDAPLCVVWGQDRLWLIEQAMLQRGHAVARAGA
jgi:2-hydroxychromene-2-carboxylate isomerase